MQISVLTPHRCLFRDGCGISMPDYDRARRTCTDVRANSESSMCARRLGCRTRHACRQGPYNYACVCPAGPPRIRRQRPPVSRKHADVRPGMRGRTSISHPLPSLTPRPSGTQGPVAHNPRCRVAARNDHPHGCHPGPTSDVISSTFPFRKVVHFAAALYGTARVPFWKTAHVVEQRIDVSHHPRVKLNCCLGVE